MYMIYVLFMCMVALYMYMYMCSFRVLFYACFPSCICMRFDNFGFLGKIWQEREISIILEI